MKHRRHRETRRLRRAIGRAMWSLEVGQLLGLAAHVQGLLRQAEGGWRAAGGIASAALGVRFPRTTRKSRPPPGDQEGP